MAKLRTLHGVMNRPALVFGIVLAIALGAAASPALADHGRFQGGTRFEAPRGLAQGQAQRRMDRDERARLREDLDSARRDVYRDRERGRERYREDRRERLSPQDRERIRRDIQDANRDLERRRRR